MSHGGPHGNNQGKGAINCYCKDPYPRGCRNPSSGGSLLCKCNLTKKHSVH